MGILNVTPDSFSDGGQFRSPDEAIKQALKMVRDGADIIDIGGESTRPGAMPVTLEEELSRVIPVIQGVRTLSDVWISIDTTKSEVAQCAIDAGADLVNDVSGMANDPHMIQTIVSTDAFACIMHMRGIPETMQGLAHYNDVVGEVSLELTARINAALQGGIQRDRIVIDPGIGFAKTSEHNLELLYRLTEFKSLGMPILIGTSRKAFIGKLLLEPDLNNRIFGTAATVAIAIANGARIVRVHDVAEMKQVCLITDAIVLSQTDPQVI